MKLTMATINYVGKEAAKALYKRCKKAVNQIKIWADSRFIQSINGKSGNSVTINKDDIGLDKVDNTPDSEKYVAHAVTSDNADMLDGMHAEDFLLKSEHENFASEISLSLSDIEERKVNVSDLVDYTVTVTENGSSGNTLKSYVLKQKGSTIGTINIPKDLVVSSGSVVVGNWVNGVFTENASGTGKAVKLVIANQTNPIYINVQDLVDVYTAEQDAEEIQIAISNTNEISATIVKSVRDKIDNAIPKVSGAAGKVAQFKADGNLESSSFEIHKSVPANAVFTDTIIDNEAGEGIEVSGSHNKIISLSTGAQAILAAATTDHIKLEGIEAGAQKNTVTSVAGKTGNIIIVKDDVGLGNVDNTADKDKSVAHAATAGDAGTLDGKQAKDFMLKSEHEEFESVIATSLTDLDERKQDKLPFTSTPSNENKVVTQNELNTAITGASSYLGTIESVTSLSTTAKKGDFYRVKTAWDGVSVGDLIIAEKDNPASIIDGVNWSLIHNQMDTDTTYTFEDGTDGFSVTPSGGDKQKVNVAVKKVNGYTVESNVPANAVFTDTIIDNIAGDGIEVSGDHNKTISLNGDVKNTLANAKTDHTNLGGHKVGEDVPINAVFTDYQTTKGGHYVPIEESASQLSAAASGGVQNWEIDVVKGVTIKRDSKGHVIGIAVQSGKLPANPNTDYQATYEGHYIPTNNNNVLNPDISILRDTSRDIAFIGSIKGDNKSHITEVTTCAVLAFTDAEIQAMVDQAIANITAEME